MAIEPPESLPARGIPQGNLVRVLLERLQAVAAGERNDRAAGRGGRATEWGARLDRHDWLPRDGTPDNRRAVQARGDHARAGPVERRRRDVVEMGNDGP